MSDEFVDSVEKEMAIIYTFIDKRIAPYYEFNPNIPQEIMMRLAEQSLSTVFGMMKINKHLFNEGTDIEALIKEAKKAFLAKVDYTTDMFYKNKDKLCHPIDLFAPSSSCS